MNIAYPKVCVASGKDKGRTGTVIGVKRDSNMVLVSGVNLVKKRTSPPPNATMEERKKGSIIQIEGGIHVSNVALLHPLTQQPTRVRWQLLNGEWTRVSKTDGTIIPRPTVEPRKRLMGPYDTDPQRALSSTFNPTLLTSPIPPDCNHI